MQICVSFHLFVMRDNAGRCHYSTMLLVNTIPGAGTAIMIFLRSARFFRRFQEYVCPAFSAPGFRSGVLRTGGTLFDGLLSILFLLISCGNQIL